MVATPLWMRTLSRRVSFVTAVRSPAAASPALGPASSD
jgi:hypothetical protein